MKNFSSEGYKAFKQAYFLNNGVRMEVTIQGTCRKSHYYWGINPCCDDISTTGVVLKGDEAILGKRVATSYHCSYTWQEDVIKLTDKIPTFEVEGDSDDGRTTLIYKSGIFTSDEWFSYKDFPELKFWKEFEDALDKKVQTIWDTRKYPALGFLCGNNDEYLVFTYKSYPGYLNNNMEFWKLPMWENNTDMLTKDGTLNVIKVDRSGHYDHIRKY